MEASKEAALEVIIVKSKHILVDVITITEY
jgi:hypothetical protein